MPVFVQEDQSIPPVSRIVSSGNLGSPHSASRELSR